MNERVSQLTPLPATLITPRGGASSRLEQQGGSVSLYQAHTPSLHHAASPYLSSPYGEWPEDPHSRAERQNLADAQQQQGNVTLGRMQGGKGYGRKRPPTPKQLPPVPVAAAAAACAAGASVEAAGAAAVALSATAPPQLGPILEKEGATATILSATVAAGAEAIQPEGGRVEEDEDGLPPLEEGQATPAVAPTAAPTAAEEEEEEVLGYWAQAQKVKAEAARRRRKKAWLLQHTLYSFRFIDQQKGISDDRGWILPLPLYQHDDVVTVGAAAARRTEEKISTLAVSSGTAAAAQAAREGVFEESQRSDIGWESHLYSRRFALPRSQEEGTAGGNTPSFGDPSDAAPPPTAIGPSTLVERARHAMLQLTLQVCPHYPPTPWPPLADPSLTPL